MNQLPSYRVVDGGAIPEAYTLPNHFYTASDGQSNRSNWAGNGGGMDARMADVLK
jgi:hypothetical protein